MITTKILREIRRLNEEEHMSDMLISETLGINYGTARYHRKKMGLPTYHQPHRFTVFKKYRIFDINTRKLIFEGTAQECADRLRIALHTFYALASKSKSGIHTKYIIES